MVAGLPHSLLEALWSRSVSRDGQLVDRIQFPASVDEGAHFLAGCQLRASPSFQRLVAPSFITPTASSE